MEVVASLAPFEKTVAGSTPFLFAQNFPGRVFKPAHPAEKDFYENIDDHPQLKALVPKYHGTLTYTPALKSLPPPDHPPPPPPPSTTITTNHGTNPNTDSSSSNKSSSHPSTSSGSGTQDHQEYLVMEDLTYGFTHPCILDVKLGTTHHDIDFSNPQKNPPPRQSKYLTAPILGFCLTGMQVYKSTPGGYEFMDKVEGRHLTATSVVDKLRYFFLVDNHLVRTDIIDKLIQRLTLVASYFQNKPAYTFRSSSLLLLYEGKQNAESADRVEVKMIDFAHAKRLPVSPSVEFKDEYGYLFGTNNFIKILESIKNGPQSIHPPPLYPSHSHSPLPPDLSSHSSSHSPDSSPTKSNSDKINNKSTSTSTSTPDKSHPHSPSDTTHPSHLTVDNYKDPHSHLC